MLTGKHVVFLGGDARQLEVINQIIKMNAKVSLIGFDNLQSPVSGTTERELHEDIWKQIDMLILPIVGTDEQGKITSAFTSKELVLTEQHIGSLPSHCLVFSGIARPYLKELCKKYHVQLFELLQRNDVAIYNSIPTVEGALMMAIQHTDITLHDSVTIVLGFGRVGLSLARVLHAIGAKVRVGVRKTEDKARAFEMGIQSFYIQELGQQVKDADLIFNTIPAMVIDVSVLTQMPFDAVIIDLASKPGGVDYQYAEKRGMKAILAPSLPGIVAPRTAGSIIAKAIIQIISEVIKKEGLRA